MGRTDIAIGMKGDTILKQSSKLALAASRRHLEALASGPAGGWLGDALLLPVEASEVLPMERLAGSTIVVVEVDPAVPSSMDRIEAIRRHMPHVAVVVAMEAADIGLVRKLVRNGVSDVVALPLSAEEILQAALSIMEVNRERTPSEAHLADVICVMRAMGRSGSTSLITHLAAQLADPDAGRPNVCIIDLDMQFGSAGDYLGLTARRTISDLFEAGDRLDDALLQSVVVADDRGIALIAAPHDIEPLEATDRDGLDRIIALARRHYDYVLVDLPRDLTNWSLSVIAHADRVLALVQQDVATLRQARRRIDLLRSIGIDMRLLSVVLNRADKRLFRSISVSDVERALGLPVAYTLALDDPHLASAQEQGLLIGEIRRKSPYLRDVAELAESMAQGLLNEVAQ